MNSKEGGEEIKKKFEEFVERNKFWIGGTLLLLIFIGSGFLLYRENYSKASYDEKIAKLENEIIDLKNIKADNIAAAEVEIPVVAVAEPEATPAEAAPVADTGKVAGTSTSTVKPAVTGMVNINTGSETELDSLTGIGPTYAKRIIEYRTANGGFKTIEEIKNVKGIGDKTFEKFKDRITVN